MTVTKRIERWLNALTHSQRLTKRYHVINYFARRRGLRRYLEIGTRDGRCLERVECPDKTGVDPNPQVVQPQWNIQAVTSDAFFAANTRRFELVFIDGLHLAEQVVRDIYHSLSVLDEPGVILLHDCNPATEARQLRQPSEAAEGSWNGDTWKALAFVRQRERDLFVRVLDVDHGIGMVIPRVYDRRWDLSPALEQDAAGFIVRVRYADLDADRAGVVGLVRDRVELERHLSEAGL